jgi:hypothetical protein
MINYGLIQNSIYFYERAGYLRVESPWTVTEAISNITKPEWATSFTIKEKNKVLVASGEQSFLAMYNKGFLPLGQFQTVTPCFRDDAFSLVHTKYFVKNELIKTDRTTHDDLMKVINVAWAYFKYVAGPDVKLKELDDGTYDLYLGDIELGSYGIRTCPFLTWIYGTGIAEPRLTRAMEIYGLSQKKNS